MRLPPALVYDLGIFASKPSLGAGLCFANVIRAISAPGLVLPWVVVHGLVHGEGGHKGLVLAHAWLEVVIDGTTWYYDPTESIIQPLNASGSRGVYHQVSFPKDKALRLLDETGHVGPWDRVVWDFNYAVIPQAATS